MIPALPKLNTISLSHYHMIYTFISQAYHTCSHHWLNPPSPTQKSVLASGIFSYPVAQMQNIKGVHWSGPRTQNMLSQWDHQEASSDGSTQIMLQRCKSWKSKVCFYVCVPWCELDVCRRLLNYTTVGLMHKCQIIICMEMATRNATNFFLFASPSIVLHDSII